MKILVTGVAGFIGFHLAQRLLDRRDEVLGLDNLNDYYDVRLKEARLSRLTSRSGFRFDRLDLAEADKLLSWFDRNRPQRVVHLAAQAGVRYSLTHPQAYLSSNLIGFGNLLEGCRHHAVEHLVYASSSSVYGANRKVPFSVHDNVDHPVSLYAATKKANELMAHSYSHLFALPTTGLRLFTVYGPWGRPDMAYFKFTRDILAQRSIEVYNHGELSRDFTYIDDIVEGVCRVLARVPEPDPDWNALSPDPSRSRAPYRLYNIGNHTPVKLMDFIGELERALGVQATLKMLPMQPGDVETTCADVEDLIRDVGFRPSTPLSVGLERFVRWYRQEYPDPE